MEWNHLVGMHIILCRNSFVLKMIEAFKNSLRGNSIHELIRFNFFMKSSLFRKQWVTLGFSYLRSILKYYRESPGVLPRLG